MSVTGLDRTRAVVAAFRDAHFPAYPMPAIIENPDWTTARYYATDKTISIPHYTDAWNEGDPKRCIHEFGHVVAFNTQGVLEAFVAAMGMPGFTHPLLNEIFAEHFTRAYVEGYDGHNWPQLVGLVPFDAAKVRTFSEALRPSTAATVVVPPVPPAPPVPAPLFKVLDIRAELPFDAANLPWPITSTKTSVTVHWPGGEFDVETDDDARNLIHAFAEEHVAKDWSAEILGVQGGAGLMYEEVIAPSGTVFLTRDPDAVLWHSNTSDGNMVSRPILVICGADPSHLPTIAQLRSLRARIVAHGLPRFAHSDWTETQCPGDALRAFITGGMEDTEMFTREEFNRWFREQLLAEITPTIVAMKTAYDPLIDQARSEGKVDADQEARIAELNQRIDKLHAI